MRPKARYELDFQMMPQMLQMSGAAFIQKCLQRREEHLAFFFNNYFHGGCEDFSIHYVPEHFHVIDRKLSGKDKILYIELPEFYYDSTVYCVAYAIVYSQSLFGGISNIRYFTVEKSRMGTSCIGTMTPEGQHVNYGDAFEDPADNIWQIQNLCRK